jgi:hypothetical protein
VVTRRLATSWEQLRGLDGFVADVDKSLMISAGVVGEYEMSSATPMQPCGIRQCRTKHRKGFIVELAGGSVSHVGKNCGKKHFGSSNWRVRLKAYRESAQAEAQAEALIQARAQAAKRLSEPLSPPQEMSQVRVMLTAFDSLPPRIRDSLVAKAEDRDGRIIRSRPASEQEMSNAKFRGERVPQTVEEVVGSFLGLKAILRSNRADYLWDVELPNAREALRESLAFDAAAIGLALRELDLSELRLVTSIKDALMFFESSNLSQIPLLPTAVIAGVKRVFVTNTPGFKIRLEAI